MRFSLFLVLFFSFSFAFGQTFTLSGKVSDLSGKGIPFASVYLKNSTTGTSANNEGQFQLKLKNGNYELVFRAVGYRETVLSISPSNQSIEAVLLPEIYSLKDVVIQSGGENPAYTIIKSAIRNRKKHLHEVEKFTADVYIKGLQRMLQMPKKFLGRDMNKAGQTLGLDSNRQGILYLSESQSKLSYLKPDYREEMIASRVSGNNRAFTYNRAEDARVNFYENLFHWQGLTSRPLISPIAENALFYYDYILIGTSVEGGSLVNKIQVIPKRNADPVFRGYIYILEDSWRIHAVDLYVTKEAGINFVDHLRIHQQFYPVNEVWMPASIKFDFEGGLLGFRFGGYYIAMFNNYDLNPPLQKKHFDEALRMTRDVNRRDSSFWATNRPIPLTEEEKADYLKKQALAKKRESKTYLDSVDKANNKFKPVSFILAGYSRQNRYTRERFTFSAPINSVFYNTVEGAGINYSVSYSKQTDSLSNRFFRLNSTVRYGFSNEKFHAHLNGDMPVGEAVFGFNLGSDVVDLNNRGTISLLNNSINSLLYEKNYLKLYEKRFVEIFLRKRLIGGLQSSFFSEWSTRRWLNNTTDYKWRENKLAAFTSNNPFTPLGNEPLFPTNQALKIGGRLSYNFSNRYETHPAGKVYLPSDYPTLGLNFETGIDKLLGSDVNYTSLSVDLSKSDIPLGLYGKTSFHISAGKFLNNKKLYYTDYKHFAGNQTRAFESRKNGFLLLPFYQFSTPDQYFEGHWEHNFSGFILNKVPLIRKLKLQEIALVNYLTTPVLPNYTEVGFGLKHLVGLKVLYVMSFSAGKQLRSGFKIAYDL